MTIALGLVTYNRPAYAEKTAKAIARHLNSVVDYVFCYNDASDAKHNGAYQRAYKPLLSIGATITVASENRGVAFAKNHLFRQMLETDADWIFVAEDDCVPQSPQAITGYIEACQRSGFSSLSFSHHGDGNLRGPIEETPPIATWPAYVGAFMCHTREVLEVVGLYDDYFVNAMEHIDWWLRAFQAGFVTRLHSDAIGSDQWLKEIPGSVLKSSIRTTDTWESNIIRSLTHWWLERPEVFKLMYGDDPSPIFGRFGLEVPTR